MMKQKNRILVVDDNETNLKILEEILEPEYDVRSCRSGEEALEAVAGFRPEVILLDIMMPGLSGYEVCRRIRNDEKLAHTKVIMVSAKALVEERLEGYEVGADDYVTKPFNDEELLSKVRVFLRLKSVEELDGFKTEILRLLSDQLATPLKSLTLPAEILRTEDGIDTAQRQRYAELITRNAARLQRFIEAVLDLSTLRAGQCRLELRQADLAELVRSRAADVRTRAGDRDVTVTEHLPEPVAVAVDTEQFVTVLDALLDNAVRSSPPGSAVAVSVCEEDGVARLRVTDHGKGIAPETLPHVFDGLVSVGEAEVTGVEDAEWQATHGLRLALAYEIARAHGGGITVTSSPASETTFTVMLPLASEGGVHGRAQPEAVTSA